MHRRMETELDRVLQLQPAAKSVHELFRSVTDDFWLWCFTEGYRADSRLRSLLPAFPPEDLQCRFTGAAGDATMHEAFDFYRLVLGQWRVHGRRPLEKVLEFGCGWGRVMRFFSREAAGDALYGIDCMRLAVDTCRETGVVGTFELIQPLPPTSLPSDAFDLVYAYSVFSHLSEAAHLAWRDELTRVLKRGGLLVVTTRPREFILTCAQARAMAARPDWAAGTAMSFQNTQQALDRFDAGEFLFEPTGGGDVLDASFF